MKLFNTASSLIISCFWVLGVILLLALTAVPSVAAPPVVNPVPAIPFIPFQPVASRIQTPRPLLFTYVANTAGFDTRIVIANTSNDALGTVAKSGSCTLTFYGEILGNEVKLTQQSQTVQAGEHIEFTLSAGGSHGVVAAGSFEGYLIADCTFPQARGYSFLGDLGKTRLVTSTPAEVLSKPRDTSPATLLFPFVSNQGGQDTGLIIANTSKDPLGTQRKAGTCTLYYYGETTGGGPAPAPTTTPTINPGEYLITTLSTGGGIKPNLHGVFAATPGFKGYVIAKCNFPHARGLAFESDLGASKYATSFNAELLPDSRSSENQSLLFRYVTNQAGFDTTIRIANTSADPLGLQGRSGTCALHYYGADLTLSTPAAQNTKVIAPGEHAEFTLSSGGSKGVAARPGFEGYIVAKCGFPLARGLSSLHDLGGTKLRAMEVAELLPALRDKTARPLLFSFTSNQSGEDTGLVILNTSKDPLGTQQKSGKCQFYFYGTTMGGGAPAPVVSERIDPGKYLIFTLSTGGCYKPNCSGVFSAFPSFKGYIMAQCSFPHARGYSFLSDLGASKYASAQVAEVINPADADADGVPDYDDSCPSDGNKTKPGICGCGSGDDDSDGDGVYDCNEACPNDANKTNVGLCGCGVSDADSDGDGTADCNDSCSDDPNKTAPGVCGCKVSDVDSDGDGTEDCLDSCPIDANKTLSGVCGCGFSDEDKNGDGAIDCGVSEDGLCIPGPSGGLDCAEEFLEASACVGANGFLAQVNIATVLNLQSTPLKVQVEYIDANGKVQGSVGTTIQANLKTDFIINDLGLAADSYGTVCVSTDAAAAGAWTGGITIYKPDARAGSNQFGDGFDFALFYPFSNPRSGTMRAALNTFHLGTNSLDPVANWVAVTDASPGDGEGLKGTLSYYDEAGVLQGEELVTLADGGRRDYAGHTGLTGQSNADAVGMVHFSPEKKLDGSPAQYHLTVTRYFYDCSGATCTNFLSAFALPHRPGTSSRIVGGISSKHEELSVLELINTSSASASVAVEFYDASGSSLGTESVSVPAYGTKHIIINKVAGNGYLSSDSLGSVQVEAASGHIGASVLHYKRDSSGKLLYAYATPLVGSRDALQVSQFNSYILQKNSIELYNTSSNSISVSIDFVSHDGTNVSNSTHTIPARGTLRYEGSLSSDLYGTVNVQANKEGLIARSFVLRENQYALTFEGK